MAILFRFFIFGFQFKIGRHNQDRKKCILIHYFIVTTYNNICQPTKGIAIHRTFVYFNIYYCVSFYFFIILILNKVTNEEKQKCFYCKDSTLQF